jgi:hypothetical protein
MQTQRIVDGTWSPVVNYLKGHPQSTTGDIATGLNAHRGTIAAGRSHIARARDVIDGQAAQ